MDDLVVDALPAMIKKISSVVLAIYLKIIWANLENRANRLGNSTLSPKVKVMISMKSKKCYKKNY